MRKYNNLYLISKLVVIIFLVISFSLLLITIYRSEVVFNGDSFNSFKYPYLVLLSSNLFWFYVLKKLSDEARTISIIITVIFVISLYLAESLMNLFDLGSMVSSRAINAQKLGITFDERSKMEVIDDLRANGVNAYPQFHPTISLKENGGLYDEDLGNIFPLSGVSNKTTVYCNEGGEYLIYLSDRYGFNNLNSEWDKEEIDWLIVGDSFAHGACVEPNKNIGGQIKLLTGGDSVINLGNGGNGPLIELATIKEYASNLNPRNILWIYYQGNDLRKDLPHEKTVDLLMNYLDPSFSQNLIKKQNDIDELLTKYFDKEKQNINLIETSEKFNLKSFLKLTKLRNALRLNELFLKPLYLSKNDIDPLFPRILQEAYEYSEYLGSNFYFVYIPQQLISTNQNVIEVVQDLNIPVINIFEEVINIDRDKLSLFPLRMTGSHYSPKGYKKIAEIIIKRTN